MLQWKIKKKKHSPYRTKGLLQDWDTFQRHKFSWESNQKQLTNQGVPENCWSEKSRKSYRNTPTLFHFFNKLKIKPTTLLKKNTVTSFFSVTLAKIFLSAIPWIIFEGILLLPTAWSSDVAEIFSCISGVFQTFKAVFRGIFKTMSNLLIWSFLKKC